MEAVNVGVARGYWKEVNSKGPCARSGHSASIYKSSMYVFGGHNGATVLNDHYCLDLISWKWETLSEEAKLPNIPSARTSHSTAVDNLTALIYVFGGSGKEYGSSNKADMFIYSIRDNAWEEIFMQGSGPSARYGHSMSFFNGNLYLFGGTSGVNFFNDLFLFSIVSHSWVQLTIKQTPPDTRYKHSSKVVNSTLLIIGGTNYKTTCKDIWEIDLNTLASRKIDVSGQEYSGKYTQAAEVYDDHVYLLGESQLKSGHAGLWKIDLTEKKWIELVQFGERPPVMCFFTMVVCCGYIVVFGGNIDECRTNKTFVFRLGMSSAEEMAPLGYLYVLAETRGSHSDVLVQSTGRSFHSQKIVLEIRVPLLAQYIDHTTQVLRMDYSENTVKALLYYIYHDEVDPKQPLVDHLSLFSISAIYGISPLQNQLCSLLSRSVTITTAKVIANYISSKSTNMLFHKNELRENAEKYSQDTLINQTLLKQINETLELSSGEQVYWGCIEMLSRHKVTSGVDDSVKAEIMRLSKKSSGKNVPQRSSSLKESSNLYSNLVLLYNTDKDIKISCKGELISAHKYILISGSAYFESFYESSNKTETTCSLDFTLKSMDLIIKYLYFGFKGIKNESTQDLSALMPIADYLRIRNTHLYDYIGHMITEVLDNENVFEMLSFAHQMNSLVMKHMILEYFIENYKQLVESPEMFSLPLDILVELHRWNAASK